MDMVEPFCMSKNINLMHANIPDTNYQPRGIAETRLMLVIIHALRIILSRCNRHCYCHSKSYLLVNSTCKTRVCL